jgi:N-succinyldiaminopimelate aminotransferase
MSVSHDIDVVELPFYDRISTKEATESLLEAAVEPNTAAIYVNWPNNPTGVVSPRNVVRAVVDFACRHDLWIFSDEVYEPFVYRSTLTVPTFFPEARDRTLRVHSFSKAFGMAGNRVGYLIGPPEAVKRVGQLATYLVYSVSTGGQIAAERALELGDEWLRQAAAGYAEIGERAAERLGVPPPDGSTFLLIDVADTLDHRGMLGFLEDCLDDGLLLAPGEVFGADYTTCVRLCFTSAEPDQVMAGVEVLAQRLGR